MQTEQQPMLQKRVYNRCVIKYAKERGLNKGSG